MIKRTKHKEQSSNSVNQQTITQLRFEPRRLRRHDLVRTDKRIDFIGGLRGTKELERLVNEGKVAVAFSLFPTTVEELLMVSDANEIMPPKSTWFEPKLRDGLLIHTI